MPSLVDDHQASAPSAVSSPSRAGKFAAGAKRKSQQIKLVSAVVMIVVAALVAFYNLFGGGPTPGELSRRRDLIDVEEPHEVFLNHKIPEDGRFPYVNPKTGKESLFPVERCYYNKDGSVKLIPTYVLLNSYKNNETETKCPDCGRRVVPHNPAPTAELARMAAEKADEPAPAATAPAAEPK